jgi:hypothetical protein
VPGTTCALIAVARFLSVAAAIEETPTAPVSAPRVLAITACAEQVLFTARHAAVATPTRPASNDSALGKEKK